MADQAVQLLCWPTGAYLQKVLKLPIAIRLVKDGLDAVAWERSEILGPAVVWSKEGEDIPFILWHKPVHVPHYD
jgi:hypothetical protein